MAKAKEPFNPFYVLLVLLGIAFTVTACAYGVMAYRATRVGPPQAETGPNLLVFLDRHGGMLMAGELFLLGLASAAAMGTDRLWSRRQQRLAASGRAGETPAPQSADGLPAPQLDPPHGALANRETSLTRSLP